jgi:hypothetical protein
MIYGLKPQAMPPSDIAPAISRADIIRRSRLVELFKLTRNGDIKKVNIAALRYDNCV